MNVFNQTLMVLKFDVEMDIYFKCSVLININIQFLHFTYLLCFHNVHSFLH